MPIGYRSITGAHRNFHVYGKPISANRPMLFRSTPSDRSQAAIRLIRMNSGSPDEKPMKMQISIRRLAKVCQVIFCDIDK